MLLLISLHLGIERRNLEVFNVNFSPACDLFSYQLLFVSHLLFLCHSAFFRRNLSFLLILPVLSPLWLVQDRFEEKEGLSRPPGQAREPSVASLLSPQFAKNLIFAKALEATVGLGRMQQAVLHRDFSAGIESSRGSWSCEIGSHF